MADTAQFYETFYAGGQDSAVGRAFGTFIAGIVTVPLSAAESIEFLTDPSYRDIVNPGGTTFVDYLGAVVNLGLDLGIINVEGIALKAAAKALKPLFKSIGKKISAKFAADGMDHAIADNIGKKIDEAINATDEATLSKAVDDTVQGKGGSSTSGNGPHSPRPKRPRYNIDGQSLHGVIDEGQALINQGVVTFDKWSKAMSHHQRDLSRAELRIVFLRLKKGGNEDEIINEVIEQISNIRKNMSISESDFNSRFFKPIDISGDKVLIRDVPLTVPRTGKSQLLLQLLVNKYSVREFVDLIRTSSTIQIEKVIGVATRRTSNLLRSQARITHSVDGFRLDLSADAIRKSEKKFVGPPKGRDSAALPLRSDDYDLVSSVVSSPDRTAAVLTDALGTLKLDNLGNRVVKFERFVNGSYFYVVASILPRQSSIKVLSLLKRNTVDPNIKI